MQVILLERINRLGALGDTVTVKDGYARNFLLPKGKALRATKDNIAAFEAKKAEIQRQNEERKAAAQAKAADLDGQSFIIIRQAGDDGRLFGSVTARDIAAAAGEKSGVEHGMVVINQAIKYVGVYQLPVNLHPEVRVSLKIAVARSENEGKDALAGKLVVDKRKGPAADEAGEETLAAQQPEPAAEEAAAAPAAEAETGGEQAA